MNPIPRVTPSWPRPAGPPGPLPRILYALSLSPGKKFGSMEEQIVLLGQAFARGGGCLVPLFSCPADESDVSQFTGRGLPSECLDLRSFRLATLVKLLALVRNHRIDLVHWNFFHPLANPYLWGLTALAPGVRCWYTDHISRTAPPPRASGLAGRVKRFLLRRYGRVLCVSRFVQRALEAQRAWSNLVHAPHFINTDRFRPDAARRGAVRAELGVQGQFVLVAVGHLIPEKGFDVAIRALAALPDEVVLWLAGEGPERDSLARLAEQLGVAGRVRLLGLCRNVEPFLQGADVFVCPSRWGEAAGLVNLEAQACGLPLLGSNVGGIPEYLDDGRSGWLFEPGDHAQLARQVESLRRDPELLAAMGGAARRLALERFSPEARLPEMLELYRRHEQRPAPADRI